MTVTLDERVRYRAAISSLDALRIKTKTALEEGRELPAPVNEALRRVAGTDDPDGRLRAVTALHRGLDGQYDERLRHAAQFRLSPYCEYIRREQPPAHHHEFLCDRMEEVVAGQIRRLAINLPPNAAKSTYCSILATGWRLGLRPHDRIVVAGHSASFAKDRLGKPVRSIIASDRFRQVFNDSALSLTSTAAEYFEMRAGGYCRSVGVGSGISGFRADAIVCDDLYPSREEAWSPTYRGKLDAWFRADLVPRLEPRGPIVLVNTRWHPDDIVGSLQASGEDWDVVSLPAIAGDDDPIGREPGELLWPERLDAEFLRDMKASLPVEDWMALYECNPVSAKSAAVNIEKIKRWEELAPPDQRRRVTVSLDLAEKDTSVSDHSAASVWLEDKEGVHYLIFADQVKLPFTDLVVWIETLAETWNADRILVEDRGAGTQYIQIRETSPGRVPVISYQPGTKSKAFRFDGVTPMLESGKALFPAQKSPWLTDVLAQIAAFGTGSSRADDLVDTVSQYLLHVRDSNVRRGVRKLRY